MSKEKKEFKQNPDFPKIGVMMQKKEQAFNGKAAYWFKVNDDVEVLVNGKRVTAFNIERPTDKYDRQIEAGSLSAEEYETKVARYEEKGDLNYMKFEFTADLRDESQKKKKK